MAGKWRVMTTFLIKCPGVVVLWCRGVGASPLSQHCTGDFAHITSLNSKVCVFLGPWWYLSVVVNERLANVGDGCSGFGGRHSKEIERKVRIICKSITGNWSRTVSASICIRIESLALHLQRLKPHQPEKCTLRIFTTTNTIRFPWKNNPPSNKRHFRCHQTKDTPLMELQLENAASKSKITCCC